MVSVVMDSSLEDWVYIGSGGFGQIYKARHLQWCCDVAVKLLHYDDRTSSSLLHEVNMMRQGSSPYVIQVLGVYQGRGPSSGPSAQLGLVMEFMERGSLALLQKKLNGTPPWPLVVRLAHQVALGINFLHSHTPALLHLDLKPSNVLLDPSLSAKLTDFGLSKFYHSVSRAFKKEAEDEGGTTSYMPPEAFDLSYTPTRASDIYSYGILLWSIVSGKQPYAHAMSSMVRFRIPQGDRPSLEEFRCQATGQAGLTELEELMQKCWEPRPTQRPSSQECTAATEKLYKIHKHEIHYVIHQVLKTLDEKEEKRLMEQIQRVNITQPTACARDGSVNNSDNVMTGRPPVQEMAGGWSPHQAAIKDPSGPSSSVITNQTSSKQAEQVKTSFAHPIHAQPPSSLSSKILSQTMKDSALGRLSHQHQRQFSSPHSFPFHIHLCNVTGFQNGNNNTMNIYGPRPLERRRHPTAPSTINLHPPH